MNKLNVKEFGELCGVSTQTIYNWIQRGVIGSEVEWVGLKRNYFIKESEIEKIKRMRMDKKK